MMKLNEPSKELVKRILSEVDFHERFIGYRLRIPKGLMTFQLYSFEEVVGFLNAPIPIVEFDVLEKWVRDVMGDDELAEHIVAQSKGDGPDAVRTERIRDLMARRLIQCRDRV